MTSVPLLANESLDHLYKLCRSFGMHPVSSVKRLELHIREESLAGWNVVPIDIVGVFPFYEQRRAGPSNFSRLIGKVSDGRNAVGYDVERYTEFDGLIGSVHGVGE